MDMGTCCAYFCTGVSFFGILTLVSARAPPCALPPFGAVSVVLSGGGAHYVSEEFGGRHGEPPVFSPSEAVKACYGAMGIYAAFLLFCGFRVYSMNAKGASKQLMDEE
ncbi:hypothetical protein T492DRAFT_860973 [Pavlovales sp. CCMP2436]|nr:hypothetical protein T492DRAFT_860973 [Pavlovales sp. CCMP2436]